MKLPALCPWVLAGLLAAAVLASACDGRTMRVRVVQDSMAPTLAAGDIVVGQRLAAMPAGRALEQAPARGAIIAFRPVADPDDLVLKRVVGLPGETVAMIDGVLHINARPVARERLGAWRVDPAVAVIRETLPGGAAFLTLDAGEGRYDQMPAFTLPPDCTFVLGDHRDRSEDSRGPRIGCVAQAAMVAVIAAPRRDPVSLTTGAGARD